MEKNIEDKNKRLILVSRLFFMVYTGFLIYFLLFARELGRERDIFRYSYNLELFKEIKRYISWSSVSETGFYWMLLNVFGNILCFVPMGFLLPIISVHTRGFFTVFFITAFASLCFETLQLATHVGTFDIDDIVLNTLGGLLGYLIYGVLKKIVCRYLKNKKRR